MFPSNHFSTGPCRVFIGICPHTGELWSIARRHVRNRQCKDLKTLAPAPSICFQIRLAVRLLVDMARTTDCSQQTSVEI